MFDMKNLNRLKKLDDRLDLRLRRCRRSVCSARLVDGAARFYNDSHSLTCFVGRDRLICHLDQKVAAGSNLLLAA
jgi:hypothetical protein